MGESSSSIIERIADAASHYIWNCGGAKGSAAATMGNSGSSSSSKGAGVGSVLTKDELRRLGDRYPFSDDELIRLARCHALVAVGTSTGLPLLSAACRAYAYDDGAGGKSAGGTNGSSSLRRPAIVDVEALESSAEACERVILPPDFGLDLERAGFGIRPPPRANNPHDHDDDDGGRGAASVSLEDFLEGAAGCSGRRGPRPALTALFECRRRSSSGRRRADAGEVLDLARRLALASAFLAGEDAGFGGNVGDNGGGNDGGDGDGVDDNDDGNGVDDSDGDGEDGDAPDVDARAQKYAPQLAAEGDDIDGGEGGGDAMTSSLIEHSRKAGGGDAMGFGHFQIIPAQVGPASAENDDGKAVSLESFLEWSETSVPQLSACLPTFVHALFFRDRPPPPTRIPFDFPTFDAPSSIFRQGGGSVDLFALACASPALGGPWHRLYNSESDGLSFSRLLLSIVGYGGPTLFVIREARGEKDTKGGGGGGIFGAFTSTPWTEGSSYIGSSDSFLFRLRPSLSVYRSRQGTSEPNFAYLNPASRSKGYDGLPHGLGFGGSADDIGGRPRLFLSETFDDCAASSFDLTFEEGPLLPDGPSSSSSPSSSSPRKEFEISELEVWGVGGAAAVASALESRDERRKADRKRRNAKLKKSADLLEDLRGGVVSVRAKNFKHREEMRGRDGCAPGAEDLKEGGSD